MIKNYKLYCKVLLALIVVIAIILFLWFTKTYTVHFSVDGGTPIPSIEVRATKNPEKPVDPVMEGQVFEGWYLNDKEFDFNQKVTEEITLVAKWKPVVNVDNK